MYKISENLKPVLQERITEFLGKPFSITDSCETEYNQTEYYDVIGLMERYDTTVNVRVSIKKDGDIPMCWKITDETIILSSRYIGEIILSKNLCVSDPCYDRDTWCMTVLKNVKPGRWDVRASIDTIDTWGERCYVLELFHRSVKQTANLDWKDHFELGVDSGTMSVIDDAFYRRTNGSVEEFESDETAQDCFTDKCYQLTDDNRVGLFTYGNQKVGVVCSSGVGDGCYPLYVVEKDGEIVAMKISFM